MNILIYSHFYPAPEQLRTRRDTLIVHYFARALRRAGHRVQVFFLSSSPVQELMKNRFRDIYPTEADYVYEGVCVHLIRFQSLVPHRSFPGHLQAAVINRKIRRFKNGLGWKADKVFIHFPTIFTGLTEILDDGVPVMGDFHNMDILMLNRPYGREAADFIKKIRNWGFRNRRVAGGLKKVEDRPMTALYSGIDQELLSSEKEISEKIQCDSGIMRIVYAGQLIPLKNVDVLIEAVKRLSFPYLFTIVGDGSEKERLRALAADHPQIVFKGRLSREETIGCMKESDVFIMLSSPETYGLVYLEAMAQGCLTAASRGEGFDGLITDGGNGFLGDPFSVDEAVRILNEIHSLGPERRKRIMLAGYKLACSMTEEKTSEHFLEINS